MPQNLFDWIVLALVLATGFVAGRASGRNSERRERLAGPPAPPRQASPEGLAQVRAALAAGHKIQAIKLLRDATGMGLKQAKEAVEAMERQGA